MATSGRLAARAGRTCGECAASRGRRATVPVPVRVLKHRRGNHDERRGGDVSEQLREVMRNVPQPVAIAVTRIPPSASPPSSSSSSSSSFPSLPPKFHGATLTSFTSLTLHPQPLVAFSLRLPSRMADYLREWGSPPPGSLEPVSPAASSFFSRLFGSSTSPSPSPSPPSPSPSSSPSPLPHLTVSLLTSPTQPIADSLSRPQADQSPTFALPLWTSTTPPALRDCIGHLDCQVVTSLPLRDLHVPLAAADTKQAAGSELFICRVLAVHPGQGAGKDEPLMHWRQKYITIKEED